MTLSSRPSRRGFVILGFPRSGTTLLSRLLDAHPDISCPPETYLLSAAARFLQEQADVEGPPIGVLSGLNFLGFNAESVMKPLRALVFDFHNQISGTSRVWVEKTAIDIFHLETLEPLLIGHVKFILLMRNPLDVIASNMDLARVMGGQLSDLYNLTRHVNGPHEGLAQAWIDRISALDAFADRNAVDCHRLRYEDLVQDPPKVLSSLFAFMDLDADCASLLEAAFARQPRIGLGDFRVDSISGVRPAQKNAWRKKLPPMAVSRIVPLLEPMMVAHGYDVPKVPPKPTREDSVRQYVMAANMKRDSTRRDRGGD